MIFVFPIVDILLASSCISLPVLWFVF